MTKIIHLRMYIRQSWVEIEDYSGLFKIVFCADTFGLGLSLIIARVLVLLHKHMMRYRLPNAAPSAIPQLLQKCKHMIEKKSGYPFHMAFGGLLLMFSQRSQWSKDGEAKRRLV